MTAQNTSTDYLARHPFNDAVYHLMPAKYAEAIFTAVDTYGADSKKCQLPRREAKVRCNAQKRIMYAAITPRRIQVQDGPLPTNLCAKCASHMS